MSMRGLLLGLILALACWICVSACDSGEGADGDGDSDADSDGDGDGDGDADSDSDGDGDGDSDIDADGDSDGDSDVDADTNVDADMEREIFVDAEPGEEICGNCTDEDGDGQMPPCTLDMVSLTPRLLSVGDSVMAMACTFSNPGYACVDLVCHSGDVVSYGVLYNTTYEQGRSCWFYNATVTTPGTWSCAFRRLLYVDGNCTRVGADMRACDLIEVE